MKTIATAAVLMMLAGTASADGGTRSEASDPANANRPIVLSDVQMDSVSAAGGAGVSSMTVYGWRESEPSYTLADAPLLQQYFQTRYDGLK